MIFGEFEGGGQCFEGGERIDEVDTWYEFNDQALHGTEELAAGTRHSVIPYRMEIEVLKPEFFTKEGTGVRLVPAWVRRRKPETSSL